MNNNPLSMFSAKCCLTIFPMAAAYWVGHHSTLHHTQAFGQSSRLISRIGDDLPGHEIAALMDAWEMSREALQT